LICPILELSKNGYIFGYIMALLKMTTSWGTDDKEEDQELRVETGQNQDDSKLSAKGELY
jgi:hypothetical protein